MNRRIFLGMIIPTIALASIVTVFAGERQAVSLQIWLACFVAAFAAATVIRLWDTAPFPSSRRLAIVEQEVIDRVKVWLSRREAVTAPPARDRRLRVIEGQVLRSRDNPRTFSQQLQPQLVRLATHHLRVTHGIDIDSNTATDRSRSAAATLLGDVSWLIETPTGDRTPTVAELDHFVDLLVTPPGVGAA